MTSTLAPAGERPVIERTGVPGLRLVRSEFRKITTTNAWWLFGIGSLVITGLALWGNLAESAFRLREARSTEPLRLPPDLPAEEVAQAQAQWAQDHNLQRVIVETAGNIFTSGQFFGLVFVMILGALVMTNEFQHQTATATFLTTPRRSRVVFGKLAAAIGLAVVFWAVTQAIVLGAGLLFFANIDLDNGLGEWDVQRTIIFNALAYLMWAVFGFGLGTLIRNQIGAIVTAMGVYLIGFGGGLAAVFLIHEYLIKEDWVMKAAVAIPPIASQVMISPTEAYDNAPIWWVGALSMIGWAIAAGLIGMWLTRRRDIS